MLLPPPAHRPRRRACSPRAARRSLRSTDRIPPSCIPGVSRLEWLSAPEAAFQREGHQVAAQELLESSNSATYTEFWLGRLRPAPSDMCSLKTEQRTKKPVRAITADGSFLRSPGTLESLWNLRVPCVEADTSRDRSPCNSGVAPNPCGAKAEIQQRRAPLSRLSNNDRRRCLRVSIEISTESLILAQDERWRRA